ncbi:MAG: GNAT family N-acetyltransferase [Candidatus Nanopelagicales bacterium]
MNGTAADRPKGVELRTPRLILRPPVQADFPGFTRFAAEPVTMRSMGGTVGPDLAWRSMAAVAGSWSLLGFGMFSVIEAATGEWVGRVGPWRPGGEAGNWPGNEIGWGLLLSATGKGYATEAAQAALDWAVETLGWREIVHCILPENTASIAVAERLGSRLLRRDVPLTSPGGDVRVDLYGQSR